METITGQILGVAAVYGAVVKVLRFGLAQRQVPARKPTRVWQKGVVALSCLVLGGLIAATGWLLFFGYRQIEANPDLWPSPLNLSFVFSVLYFVSFYFTSSFPSFTGNLLLDQIFTALVLLGLASGATVGLLYALPTITEVLLLQWATTSIFCAAGVRIALWLFV